MFFDTVHTWLRRSIFDKVFDTLDRCYVHHSTYARNRLGMVAGLATLEVMENDKLVEIADAMGKRLMDGLNKLKERYSLLDVYGHLCLYRTFIHPRV